MSDSQVFVDTNILVYAHDLDAGAKHQIARDRVKELWKRPLPPAVSVQVLQESYVNLVRKGLAPNVVAATVTDYFRWHVVNNDPTLLVEGIAVSQRWKISLWDGLIVSAALRANAPHLWSEDLSAGQDYGGVVVVNPLLP